MQNTAEDKKTSYYYFPNKEAIAASALPCRKKLIKLPTLANLLPLNLSCIRGPFTNPLLNESLNIMADLPFNGIKRTN